MENLTGARLLTDAEKTALVDEIKSRILEDVQVEFFDYYPSGIELDFSDPRRPHTYIGITYQGKTQWTQASLFVDLPGMKRLWFGPDSVLPQTLGVTIVQPKPQPKPQANPVGEPWPEVSQRFGVDAFRPAPGAPMRKGWVWKDDSGLYVAQTARNGFWEFFFWQKVA